MTTKLRLSVLPDPLAVCRLGPEAAVPTWMRGTFTSATLTADELSIVCDDAAVPEGVSAERGWRARTGSVPRSSSPRISIFLISTYDTDYLLVKAETFARAVEVLRGAGYEIG